MADSFTPGPWSLRPTEDNGHYVMGTSSPGISHAVAEVHSGKENARLIAAAPDLLEALREWDEYMNELDRTSDPNDPIAIMRKRYHGKRTERTRAAIAKAVNPA